MHRTSSGAAFAAADHPVDPVLWRYMAATLVGAEAAQHVVAVRPIAVGQRSHDARQIHRTEQRLHRQEAHARRHREQLRDVAVCLGLVDDRRAEPDVIRQPVDADMLQHRLHVADALRQNQPVEVRGIGDQPEQVSSPRRIDSVVEHVGERRAEHALVPAVDRIERAVAIPLQRLPPVRGRRAAARGAGSPVHGGATAEARVARLGVAVIAARADLLAAFPRIERVVAPLDFCVLAHGLLSAPQCGQSREYRSASRRNRPHPTQFTRSACCLGGLVSVIPVPASASSRLMCCASTAGRHFESM